MARILVVEDNPMNLDMLTRRLQKRGYETLSTQDGASAVEMAASEQPDLILMDLSLPVMDGWEATRQIKANPATHHIPIIALTAHAVAGDRERGLAAGCDEYETKPVNFVSLTNKMRFFLNNSSSSE
ncbi:MAG: response regulator [Anaerolineae bacterium]|nr:response regulator [Anaerolineae bacterium]MCA9891813.1 response regulator [Anaerolineae bacterium]